MITSLTLENFRCFQKFQLERIGRITLIGGKNNVGKTTLLESIFLIFAYFNPDVFIKLNGIRGSLTTSFSPDVTWEHLFYNKNVVDGLNISVSENGELLSFKLQRDDSFLQSGTFVVPVNNELRMVTDGYPLKITYRSGEKEDIGHIIPVQNGLTIKWNHSFSNNSLPKVQYIGISSELPQSLAAHFGNVVKAGQKQEIIDVLKLLEPELEDISTVAEDIPRLYIQKKGRPLLPLSVMGNGISRLVEILCSMLEYQRAIILIDEIESGFHYSFFPQLWKSIEFLAKKMDVQIFATTHSYECTRSALSSFEDKESFCYIRLDKEEENIVPYIFPTDVLEYAFEQSIEIR